MATNKFATMLHRNTNKIIVALVYAFLEWVLIILLLLNSLFSYLIKKFSIYFGLKPPCLWCSRVDHFLEPNKIRNSYRDLVCDTHATEISNLSYCSTHHKLAEPHNMCEECLADSSIRRTQRIAFISLVSDNHIENGEKIFRCSCCNESLSCKLYPPFWLLKPSWGALDHTQKDNFVIEAVDDDNSEGESPSNHKENDNEIHEDNREENEHQILSDVGGFSFKEVAKEDESLEIINMHFKNYAACELNRLIPVELIDSSTTANQESYNLKEEDLREHEHDHRNRPSDSEAQIETELNVLAERAAEGQLESLEISEGDNDNHSTLEVVERKQDMVGEACRQVAITQEEVVVAMEEPDDLPGKEVCEETVSSLSCRQEDQSSTKNDVTEISTSPDVFMAQNDLGLKSMGKSTLQEKTILVEKTQEGINNHLSMPSEPNEIEEEKFPDTPTSADSLHYLQKKLLLFEKREPGAEESLDGSVVSEMEGGDAVNTIERLKAALKSERKALSALYAELEEERSASAIAANQTMAMITRLQEEKAAMQMEAFQYQRMMEEQAEYDQEALQLLNELMIKREKEKQELEKELEIFRKRVLDYETKEKMRMMRRIKDGSLRSRNSSASCSNVDDSDELSIDLNREAKDEDSSYSGHQDSSQNTSPDNAVLNLEEIALDCVKHMSSLDESLAEYEEERLSILDQLKALEEKLITLGDDEGFLEDGKSVGNSSLYGVKEFEDHDFTSPEENGISDGFLKDKHYPDGKTMNSMAKRLLPLLDATSNENEEGLLFEEKSESEYVEMQNSLVSNFELDGKKLAIEDEVDHVYERLQALEADREFLKHCMSSIKKGDKGVDLLQEILQHLRDLKAVEIRVKNMTDDHLD
ncbi:myosin-binding protein 2-like isoform X2 [Alnus glutinosa]|uniref:myosin-binding protein 2-like isoform X2 n=1 Tax=Alnus glutinosa TaxID=3517 RepID=UPI002D78E91E|nr:myosin-binding protein 2-like isoform X2 [Alnus glutinosa]